MRWISSRWSIEGSLVGVALILALTIAWHNENAVQEIQLAGAESSARRDSNLRESPSNLDTWRAELTRVTREITALRVELERLAAVVETTMARNTGAADEAESFAPLPPIPGHDVDPKKTNPAKTEHTEATAAEEVDARIEEQVEHRDETIQKAAFEGSAPGASTSLEAP
jgi:hypothetical protein